MKPALIARRASRARTTVSAAIVLACAGALCTAPAAAATTGAGLIVVPTPASGPQLSFFKLPAVPGRATAAGTLDVRNASRRPVRVLMSAVEGRTIDTLGSTYAQPGSRPHRSATWLRLGVNGGIGGSGTVTLGAGQSAMVPVSVAVPAKAAPGDYLAGVSVESLDQHTAGVRRKGVAIATAVRYAIGVEVSVPGPRHPAIAFTGAELRREPAGVTFLLRARNPGNVILQNVHGAALITSGKRTVTRAPLGPGTFVSSTAIAYPILTAGERPKQGTVYRVRAWLQYAGGIARLDTLVRFGRQAALRQQAYGGPRASSGGGGLAPWAIALIAVGALALLGGLPAVLLVRRRRDGRRSPLHTLEAALASSRATGMPLSLIAMRLDGVEIASEVARGLRSRLRSGDRLCRLGDRALLVVAADTDIDTAEALATDLRRHVERGSASAGTVAIDVLEADSAASGPELLARVQAIVGGRAPAAAR